VHVNTRAIKNPRKQPQNFLGSLVYSPGAPGAQTACWKSMEQKWQISGRLRVRDFLSAQRARAGSYPQVIPAT